MLPVECLGCGSPRLAAADPHGRVTAGECAVCGYVGWAPSNVLTEPTRRALRERPPEHRIRLHAA